MARFLGGFASASVLWAAFTYAVVTGSVTLPFGPPSEVASAPDAGAADIDLAPDDKTKRPRRTRGKRPRRYAREGLSGDDLGGPDTRQLDMNGAGGEQQLRSDEIERQFDAALPQIRRCLILAASDEPVTGKVVFGLRIAGASGVTAVNLRGPGAITQTEAGACMQKAARTMRFRTFDGPDMLVHLPMTLE